MISFAGTEKILDIVATHLSKKGHRVFFLNIVEDAKYIELQKLVRPFSLFLENVFVFKKEELPSKYSSIWFLFQFVVRRKINYEVDIFNKVISVIDQLDLIIVDPPYLLSGIKKGIINCNSKAKVVLWNHGSLSGMKNGNTIRDITRRAFWCWMLGKWLKSADGAMAISHGIKKMVLQCNPELNVELVFNPINLGDRKLIINNSETPIFIYVGRLEDRQKNLSLLIDALADVSEFSWELKVFGDGPSGDKIKKYANSKNINNKITWYGFVEDPFEKVDKATCLILTSRFEGFPLVLVEAIERGLPVVASDCPTGPSDIVIQNVNGCLFKSEDKLALVKILKDIVTGHMPFKRGKEIIKTVNKYESRKVLKKIEAYLDMIAR